MDDIDRFSKIKRILVIVLALNWLVAFSKLIYGLVTRSASMTADGIHSFADGASNIIGLVGIWAAGKPVDIDHPYGHKKYETFATLGIAAVLFIVAFDVIKDAFARFFHPIVPDVTALSFILMVVTFVINVIVMRYEHKRGCDLSSDILICDATHTKSDIYVTISVIVSLVAIKTGFPIIDTLAAFGIACLIARCGFDILKKSSAVLCDGGVVEMTKIERAVRGIKGVKSVHHIRTRGREDDIHVDLHVRVDTRMHVDTAHDLSHQIQEALKEKIPGVTDVIVHVEPHNKNRT